MLPFTSLDAATTTGAGAALDLERVESEFTWFIWSTGSPSAVTSYLEGSHDGAHWAQIGDPSTVTNGGLKATAGGLLVRYVRANISRLDGGSSPTVTVTIAVGGAEEE